MFNNFCTHSEFCYLAIFLIAFFAVIAGVFTIIEAKETAIELQGAWEACKAGAV